MPNLILKIHKTADELPERSGHYLCANMEVYGDGQIYWLLAPYSSKHKLFNARDTDDADEASKTAIPVHYWMELPETVEGWEGVSDD